MNKRRRYKAKAKRRARTILSRMPKPVMPWDLPRLRPELLTDKELGISIRFITQYDVTGPALRIHLDGRIERL